MEHITIGMDRRTHEALDHIARSLFNAGYDPYAQLMGYIMTGDVTCITRRGGARTLIRRISMEQVRQYADSLPRSSRT